MKRAKLVLKDGTEFEGYSFGFARSTAGEVVFNTGMVGYPQSLTDPSYSGQILVFTYPLIGNYGIESDKTDEHGIPINFESDKIHVKGVIVSEFCVDDNHWDSEMSIRKWFDELHIPAIFGIDTRALTIKIRETGVMLGKIVIDDDIDFYDPDKDNQVALVSRKDVKNYGKGKYKVIVVDCGIKYNILRCLLRRDVRVKVVPWDYDFTKEEYDGLFISNGPGDPMLCDKTIEHLKKAIKIGKPIFGICLGNQLLGLAGYDAKNL